MLSGLFMLAAVKCYGDLGCFPTGGNFHSIARRPLSVNPRPPEAINASFLLYSREKSTIPHVINFKTTARLSAQTGSAEVFRANRTSKIIIHGFQEDGYTKQWIKDLVSALLNHDDYNVIVVDWGSGALMPYHQAVANARLVGAILTSFIVSLKTLCGASFKSFHVIGHSLGAHIAGYAGERLKQLGRITGLDPAKPYFENTDPSVRLDPSDAKFVDVIHTDGGPIYSGGMGMWQRCGHVDFFPNGGKVQPGCGRNILPFVQEKNGDFLQGTRQWLTCRHKRAYMYFTESVNAQCPFMAVQCRSNELFRQGKCFACDDGRSQCAPMGFHAKPLPRNGQVLPFYLRTGKSEEFCRYHQRVTVYFGRKKHKKKLEKGRLFARLFQDPSTRSKRLHFSPREITFAPGWHATSVVGTAFAGNVTSVRIQWQPEEIMPNPLNYFNGVTRTIWIDWVSVETLETGAKTVFCSETPNHGILAKKIYTFVPRGRCIQFYKRSRFSENALPIK